MQPKFIITIDQNNAEYNVQFRVIHQGADQTLGFRAKTLGETMVEIEKRIQSV